MFALQRLRRRAEQVRPYGSAFSRLRVTRRGPALFRNQQPQQANRSKEYKRTAWPHCSVGVNMLTTLRKKEKVS